MSLGNYTVSSADKFKRVLQKAASVAVLLAPVFLVGAFLFEALQANFDRPLTLIGILLSVIGIMSHVSIQPYRKAGEI